MKPIIKTKTREKKKTKENRKVHKLICASYSKKIASAFSGNFSRYANSASLEEPSVFSLLSSQRVLIALALVVTCFASNISRVLLNMPYRTPRCSHPNPVIFFRE